MITPATPQPAAALEACDHDWKFVDDSFDHEFGCQQVHSFRCEKCDATKDAEPADHYDES
jgi:hypothetical protein